MIYNLGINSAFVTNKATFQKMLNVFKSIITNKPVTDEDMPAFNAPYSQQILGKYPTTRPYTFIYQEDDKSTPVNQAYATLWFKKEHPLYKDHFLYIGLRFSSCQSINNYAAFALHIDIAELVTEDGTIVNRVFGSHASYSGNYQNVVPTSSPTTMSHYQPVIGRANVWYFNQYTLNISDFGLGLFRCDMNASPLNAGFTHYIGTLALETLATPVKSGETANKLAFLPENYPMQALIYQNGNINSSGASSLVVGLIRIPNLAGVDVAVAGTAFYAVVESPIYRQPTSAYNPVYGSGTLGGNQSTMEVYNANGEKASELYPEYLRNPYGASPLAKLPILRPLQANADYAHYGRAITLNETENYIGIQALEDWDPNIMNVASNIYLQTLKGLAYRQAYLRMD
ncbi:hypothetical protein [Yersinia ruckeri]|uniref:hypothetical protein n=1 Tax=Yersinia ruckeri TaxID=29486 RepID=UPI002238476F|nr:hypothetical protein [Yersinia ruckeri]MCW6598838.1 hypothetical protein [Yersinia ruckeri]